MSIDHAESTADGLARRIAELSANDPQFAAAVPLQSVAESVEKPGMRLPEIVKTVIEGYADRTALGQRAVGCGQPRRGGEPREPAAWPVRSLS